MPLDTTPTSGSYKPTNNYDGPNPFTPPVPSPSTYTTLADAFDGIAPNGVSEPIRL